MALSIGYGLDIIDIIVLATSLLAVVLGTVSFMGYRRDKRKKLLFMSFAFVIVVIKGALIVAGDFIVLEEHILDVIAHLLDFAVLLFFFIAIMTK